ncbi:MAG: polyribonucleotide nucleotidyltransferase [Armatimonadota bacterium]|nr:polyribonucleotide nucleotidyltransferase [Armatimonadota bacterium]
MIQTITFEVGGKELSIETGRVAKQAGGAVLLGMGESVVLGTATMSAEPRTGLDFFPLTCDYEERKYSVGKIPGGFMKRGGRPSEKAILTSRLIDRPVRPLFPKGMRNDVQCVAMPFAMDQENPTDVLALNAVSAALSLSDVPWNGPIAGVRIGRVEGELVLFPTVAQLETESDLDLIVAGTRDAILMVEAGANEVVEADILKAMAFGLEAIKVICDNIEKFAKEHGKAKREVPLFKVDEDILETIRKASGKQIRETIVNPDKATRESALNDLLKEVVAHHKETTYAEDDAKQALLAEAVDSVIKETVRDLIIKDGKRPDGRGTRDIRQITCDPGLLPKVHGSGLFTRGQTQVMTVVTLGAPGDGQTMDGLEEVENKKYMHFYNFPPYSVGECRMMRGPGRREIGHGALAERSLVGVLPTDQDFPYTMLLISEVLESNGSTSMASVCGSTLALLDCGVPIKAPVAGIAMGLMTDGKEFKVLTDIQGMEDFCGDMDFKVAGTRDGITAMQLDTKISGIPEKVMIEALQQAKEAREHILDKIDEAIPERRTELNANAPRIETIQIDPQRIGELIGPGGKTIKKITAESGAQIDVEQDGRVFVLATNKEVMDAAANMIKGLMILPEVGDEFSGPVSRLFGRGAMVEFLPGKEGMVPLEHLSAKPIRRPEDVVNLGDIVRVKVHEIDAMGRTNLTALGLEQELPSLSENASADPSAVKSPERRSGGDRGGRGGGDRGDRRGGGGDRDRGGDRGGRGGYNRDRRDDRGGDRDRGDRPAERGERSETQEPSQREEPRSEPELKPREDGAFPTKVEGDPTVVARFRPKR